MISRPTPQKGVGQPIGFNARNKIISIKLRTT